MPVRCTCGQYFYDDDAHAEHLEDSSRHAFCQLCNRDFLDDAWRSHCRSKHSNQYCVECRILVDDSEDYDKHCSWAHKPVACVGARAGCKQQFGSAGAMTAHLESGACVSGMTRRALNARIARIDQQGLITTDRARRLLKDVDEEPERFYHSTSSAWTGRHWKCMFCGGAFRKQESLDQHLASPRHQLPPGHLYRCPGTECHFECLTLSGLGQHIETSSRCQIRQNTEVQLTMTRSMGLAITAS